MAMCAAAMDAWRRRTAGRRDRAWRMKETSRSLLQCIICRLRTVIFVREGVGESWDPIAKLRRARACVQLFMDLPAAMADSAVLIFWPVMTG
jgi:hypothetical protein